MKSPIAFFLAGLGVALAISAIPADAILFSGASSGGGGATQITTLLVNNSSGGTVSNQQVSTLIPIGVSDMAAGNKLQIRKNDGVTVVSNVQQDACATWKQNGNTKVCAVSFIEPDSMTTGQTLTYQVWKTPGAPVTTPNVSTANITGNTNFVFKTSFNLVPSSGTGTAETGTWDLMDVNYVLNNCTQWNNSTGFGSDPACGWEVTATGGSKYGLHLFMYAKRESDNAIHEWIRTDAWIDFWGSGSTPCPCSVSVKVGSPNIFGPLASGTVGSAGGGYVLGADFYNGATRMPVDFGGPNDSRAAKVTFDHTSVDFHGVTGAVVFPGGAWVGNLNVLSEDFGIVFTTSGGTLPSALTANVPQFITLQCRDIAFCAPPSLTKFGIYDWQYIIDNTTPHITLADDGTCSNNCTAFPVVVVNPWGGTVLAQTDGGRFWVGANGLTMTAPPVSAEENFTYLTQTTHAVPPYLTNLWGNFPAQSGMTGYGTKVYYPNSSVLWGDYNTGGDNPGDSRIGYVDNFGAISLFAPFDTTAVGNSKIYAAGMEQARGFMINEHTGRMPVMNHGHAGTPYTNLGSVYDTTYNSTGGGGTGGFPVMVAGVTGANYWAGANDIPVHNRYQPILEASHLPMPAQGSYLLTGLPEYLDQMQSEAEGMTSGVNTSSALAGTTYYRALTVPVDQQTRGIAWAERLLDQADYFTPDADPLALYMSDLVSGNYAFSAAMVNNPGTIVGGFPVGGATSYESTLGIFWDDVRPTNAQGVGQVGQGQYQPWQSDYMFQTMVQEKLRGEYDSAGVTTFVNYLAKFSFGRVDSNVSGCLWAGPTRFVSAFAPLTTFDNYFDFTTIAQDWTTFYNYSNQASRTFTGTLSGNTLTVSAFGSYGFQNMLVPANAGFPWVGGSVVLGSGVPANTTVLSGAFPTYTVSGGVGGTSSGPFVSQTGGGESGLLNRAGSNPGAPPWAGCAANAAVTPLTLDSTQSSANGPVSIVSEVAMSLAYASWLGLTGATADYNTVRNVQALGLNPDVDHNSGTSNAMSFFTYSSSSGTTSNATFAIGPQGATYP